MSASLRFNRASVFGASLTGHLTLAMSASLHVPACGPTWRTSARRAARQALKGQGEAFLAR